MQDLSSKLWKHVDTKLVAELQLFYHKVNERSEFNYKLRDTYEPPNEALGINVEYFHPVITYDDRMRYICENIVTNDNCETNSDILGNTIISHFYGARGIHTSLTGIENSKHALVSFAQLAYEQRNFLIHGNVGHYTTWLRVTSTEQKKKQFPFWGTTELHTSIQNAARKWIKAFYGADTEIAPCYVAEWIASWANDGTFDKMMWAQSFEELYHIFKAQPGIGSYYAYHGASSNSVNPLLRAYHDERFCDPGPGARKTAKAMFPGLSEKEVSLDKRIIWFRENQYRLMDCPTIHESFHNITANGVTIFPEPQDELKTYGTEVCFCQFDIYRRLSENPDLIKFRKVSRINTPDNNLDNFL